MDPGDLESQYREHAMAVKLIDLQVIYGVAGARDQFDDLVAKLVMGEYPKADKVRVFKGDGGIDSHVGNLTDPDGIDVFQAKFFPQGVGESQKAQIRDSFKRAVESTIFKTKAWTLCLPIDLGTEEKAWFEKWRKDQASFGIVIQDVWGASKLERLLYEEKNKGVREAFFKEEHLTQIRQLHETVPPLLTGMAQRLGEEASEREQAARTAETARQAAIVDQYVKSMRDSYVTLVAKQAKEHVASGKSPSHWEVVIRPSLIPKHPLIESLKRCWEVVDTCQARSNGWSFPVMKDDRRQPGSNWTGSTRVYEDEVESWRLSQHGLYVHMFPIFDDVHPRDTKPISWSWDIPKGFVPEKFFHIHPGIRTFTHIFQFAAKLSDTMYTPETEGTEITIRLTDTADRVLVTRDDPRSMIDFCRATVPSLDFAQSYTHEELRNNPKGLAVKTAIWFFERFDWHQVSVVDITRIQSSIFSKYER